MPWMSAHSKKLGYLKTVKAPTPNSKLSFIRLRILTGRTCNQQWVPTMKEIKETSYNIKETVTKYAGVLQQL